MKMMCGDCFASSLSLRSMNELKKAWSYTQSSIKISISKLIKCCSGTIRFSSCILEPFGRIVVDGMTLVRKVRYAKVKAPLSTPPSDVQ